MTTYQYGSPPQPGPPATAGWYPDPELAQTMRYWNGMTWTEYRQPAMTMSVAATRTAGSNVFSIIAFVCAGISVLFFPVLFGPAGLILGAVGLTKKERFAPIAIAAAAGCMIAGMVIGAAVWSSF